MSLLDRPGVLAWVRKHVLCRIEGEDRRFALTFDDGPSPTNTPRVIELLERYEARGTFFVLGRKARRHPELVRRLRDAGQEIGLHGYGHAPPPLLPLPFLRTELRRAERVIVEAAGVRPRFYRAPYGLLLPGQARRVREWGYVPVLGDVYPQDPRRPGVKRIVDRSLRALRPGSILILHDASAVLDFDRGQTIEALEAILETTRKRGWQAVAVGELCATRSDCG